MNTPFAISKLNRFFSKYEKVPSESLPKRTETSQEEVNDSNHMPWDKYTVNGKRVVSKMLLDVFQKNMVEHSDIKFRLYEIDWPCRISKPMTI